MVYVLNKDGQPLMPTNRHGKVRRTFKNQKSQSNKTLSVYDTVIV